ncbi:hypothetical protein EV284_6431 [Streptomyces sp. BK022]|uniref:hypothetical protein n=1 Tax=Streptomyces sp. BK022 TaxID=2512123 RepID=UPI00102983DD|nr:hypothetical protein [Streptomyces sp. BK022]RZU28265.1 hypothetical protein EV284_6431 [Streptomyces sp. BK022]
MSSPAHRLNAGSGRPDTAATLTVVPPPATAVVELEQVVGRLRRLHRASPRFLSAARLQQIEWVAAELTTALPLGLSETAGESLAALLAEDAVGAYLAYSRSGFLRTMPTVSTDPTSSDASERIRIFCLDLIAREAKVPFTIPPALPQKLSRTRPDFADLITSHLDELAERHLVEGGEEWVESFSSESLVRGRAMWAVMRRLKPRIGELEVMGTTDCVADASGLYTVTVIRMPQGGNRGERPEADTATLDEADSALMGEWLKLRTELITRLRGGVPDQLWLAVPPAADYGVPINRRGISRFYKKVADQIQRKQDAAGVPEEDLIPTRWETLRRALAAPD